MKPIYALLFAATMLSVLFLGELRSQGQTAEPSADQPPGRLLTWRAQFPSGEYVVALHSIASISTHEYVVDGVAKVYELTINTRGSATARIYHLEALSATPGGIGEATVGVVRDKINEVRERLDTAGITNAVVKNYPATTHAHTIEYRVASRQQVQELYESALKSWTRGREGSEKVTE
jgi:hypothetical protein